MTMQYGVPDKTGAILMGLGEGIDAGIRDAATIIGMKNDQEDRRVAAEERARQRKRQDQQDQITTDEHAQWMKSMDFTNQDNALQMRAHALGQGTTEALGGRPTLLMESLNGPMFNPVDESTGQPAVPHVVKIEPFDDPQSGGKGLRFTRQDGSQYAWSPDTVQQFQRYMNPKTMMQGQVTPALLEKLNWDKQKFGETMDWNREKMGVTRSDKSQQEELNYLRGQEASLTRQRAAIMADRRKDPTTINHELVLVREKLKEFEAGRAARVPEGAPPEFTDGQQAEMPDGSVITYHNGQWFDDQGNQVQ